MPRILVAGVERKQHRYEIEIEWNDAEFVGGELSFRISGSRRRLDGRGEVESLEATVGIRPGEENQPQLFISIGGEDFHIDLRDLVDEASILDRIPAHFYTGDPLTGCIVRAGISSVLSQIIECRNETTGVDWYKRRARAMWRCLREHVPSMCGKAAFRAVRCIARAGF
jgi:hypothetical protein